MVKTFPPEFQRTSADKAEQNEGVQLFGRRLIREQTPLEFLTEFLLVAFSPRKIADDACTPAPLPDLSQLRHWPDNTWLVYSPRARLGLKLFALLGVSRLEARHLAHRRQYEKTVLPRLTGGIRASAALTEREVLQSLENLLMGFVGVGHGRAWCAQTFLPLCRELLGGEVIWNESLAKREQNAGEHLDWQRLIKQAAKYFTMSRHRFMARGGEVLYLQLCNLFRWPQGQVDEFVSEAGLDDSLEADERDLPSLHERLCCGLERMMAHVPGAVGHIAEWIDEIDPQTTKSLQLAREEVKCYWVPEDSWREAFLFAVELARLTEAAVDPVERIDLLTMACVMQVLRTMCAQTVRHLPGLEDEHRAAGGSLGYAWIASPVQCLNSARRDLSRRSVSCIQDAIYRTLRNRDVIEWQSPDGVPRAVDDKYGHGLFLSLSKRSGLVIPPRGAGARFVLDDRWIRYLVFSMIRPGRRRDLREFLADVYRHTGIAVDGDVFRRACQWSGTAQLDGSEVGDGEWLEGILREGGFLHELSDAYSLVENPFSYGDQSETADRSEGGN